MFLATPDCLTEEQKSAWAAVCARAEELPAETGDGNGWLFHGTDHLSSTHIMESGLADMLMGADPAKVWFYFGNLDTARFFALKRMNADSPPAILAVRTSDLIAHGMEPDPNYALEGEEVAETWQSAVAAGETVRVRGAKFDNIVRFDIAEIPLHADAAQVRAERLAGDLGIYGATLPHAAEAAALAEISSPPFRP